MTARYRKLNPTRGTVPYRDTWHAHPIAHRRDTRPFVLALTVLAEGAVFLFCLGVVVVALWLVTP